MAKSSLDSLFDELNTLYWRGRLPKYKVRRLSARRLLATGLCDHQKQKIYLASELTTEKLRPVLLHEMIHIQYPYDNHSPLFRRGLKRLIERGEKDLEKHLSQCLTMPDAGPPRLTQQMFNQELREMRGEIRYWTEANPRRRWPTLLRNLRSLMEWPYWERLWDRFGEKQMSHCIYTWSHKEWEQARSEVKAQKHTKGEASL